MPKYKFTALAADGSTTSAVEEATDLSALYNSLNSRGLQPVTVELKRSLMQFEITKKRVPRKELMHFFRQLAVFVRSGISIIDALHVVNEEQENKLFKEAIADMVVRLESGQTFSQAAAAHTEAFPDFSLSILKSAEVTGNLEIVLNQLADYIERDLEARQKVVSALMYPAVVAGMSAVTVVIMAVYVLPKFETFFAALDAELPLPTRMLLGMSRFFTNWWPFILLTIVAIIAGFIAGLRTDKGKELRDRALLKAPGFGDVLRHAILERFCRILSSMVQAGVALDTALGITAEATNNVVYRRGLDEAREAMIRGEGLAEPLAATGLFPAAARQMLRVGESTGTLEDQMQVAADYFDRELDHKIKKFTSLFEPAVIIAMGVIVGFVAIAMVSAMYGIYNQVEI